MINLSHSKMIALSGFIWMAVGCMLLSLGLNYIIGSILAENLASINHPLLDFFSPFVGGIEDAAMIIVALGLLIGFFKGRVVFAKTVGKTVARITAMPNPAPLSQLYTKAYYFLLLGMVGLGFLVRFLTNDIRGFVDVAVGSALINGAVLYFKQAYRVYLEEKLVKVTVSKK